MKLVKVAEMQAIEREADAQGLTYAQMMENAGRGLAEMVESFYGYEEERSVVALVGSGNNGGDTLIALEHLARDGWQSRAWIVRPRRAGDKLMDRAGRAGVEVVSFVDDTDFTVLDAWLDEASVLLDGVLGTGIKLPLKPEIGRVLGQVKGHPNLPEVVAVDCPSGVDLDSGEVAEETIPADLTVCMAAVKSGLLRFPAYHLAGMIEVVDIGLPDHLPSWERVTSETVTEDMVRSLLPLRRADGHKGTFGTVGVVAGSLNFTGAAYLCAAAAYRVGAGLVQIAAPAPLHAALAGQIPEATWVLLPHEMGVIAEAAFEVLVKKLERVSLLLWGPGFGLEDATAAFVRRLVEGKGSRPGGGGMGFVRADVGPADAAPGGVLPPMVIDADGLKLLARVDGWPGLLPGEAVLTPHPGEMAILTGMQVDEVQADRLGVARRFAAEWGHVVVLKGAMTVIAAPDGQVRVIPVATTALAHAGTGDVLAGIIAGLRAQGMAPFDAAAAGAWIHAQAGLLAAEELGHEASVLAGDLLDVIPEVLAWVW
ncbi:MAG: NAD(P)H-hydrate dehydratase [Anaerolineae bacterium]|nr:NAD(P)H-hydrate dehydratase [Anaerolineae bacterium]